MTNMMTALVCDRISEDLSGVPFCSVERPEPGEGEALIRVRAAGLNFPDILMLSGEVPIQTCSVGCGVIANKRHFPPTIPASILSDNVVVCWCARMSG